ncbi:MAG: hypothetical protein V3575_06275 [Candidatus Absconditabacteria bacterium]
MRFIKNNVIRFLIGMVFIVTIISLYQKNLNNENGFGKINLNNKNESQEINLIDIKQKEILLKNTKVTYSPIIYSSGSVFGFIYSSGSVFFNSDKYYISQYDLNLDTIQNKCTIENKGIWGSLYSDEKYHLVEGNTPYLIYLSDEKRNIVGANYTLRLEILNLNNCESSSIILDNELSEKNLVNTDQKNKGIMIEKISNLKNKQGEDYIIVYTNIKIYSYNLTQKKLISQLETNNIDIRLSGVGDVNNDGEDDILLLDKHSGGNYIVSFDYNLQKILEIKWPLGHQPNYNNGLLGYNATYNTYIMSCLGYFTILNKDGKLLKLIPYKERYPKDAPKFSIVNSNGKELFLIKRTLFDGDGNELQKLPDPTGKPYKYILIEAAADIDDDGNDEIILLNNKQSLIAKGFDGVGGFKYDYDHYLQIVSQDGKILFNKKIDHNYLLNPIIPIENGFRIGQKIFFK